MKDPFLISLVLEFVDKTAYGCCPSCRAFRDRCDTLARAALVNRLWNSIATPALWSDVDLLAVMKLLPPDVWYFYDDDGHDEEEVAHQIALASGRWSSCARDCRYPNFALWRPVQANEWASLLRHTTFIKNLRTMGDPPAGLLTSADPSGIVRMSPIARRGILYSPPSMPLFPNMEDLEVRSIMNRWSIMSLFASDKMTCLNLEPDQSSLDVMTNLNTLFSETTSSRHHLRRLSITNSLRDDVDDGVDAELCLAAAISEFTALESLSVYFISREVWGSVAALSRLHTLEFTGSDRHLPSADALGSSAFGTLRNLTIQGTSDIQLLHTVFAMRQSGPWNLVHFDAGYVIVNDAKDCCTSLLDISTLADVYTMIGQYINRDTLQRLRICTNEGPMGRFLAEHLQPLLIFTNLTSLTLSNPPSFSATPVLSCAEVYRMANSWPWLKHLELHIPCSLSSLVAFSMCCGQLATLSLNVIVDGLLHEGFPRSESALALEINVRMEADDRELEVASAFARAVYPRADVELQRISGEDPAAHADDSMDIDAVSSD